ncbi:MAG: M1 family metallopeptidase [Flavobacteriales bacterium]|nr:M1 family metallopeptidase [Flavobacteriales bacterium]MCB9165991.1 M1 family metallopeptidase [Flavobacteriales bacterium]
MKYPVLFASFTLISIAHGQSTCLAARNAVPDNTAFKAAAATRSDSIDILDTRIDLDLTQVGSGLIFGKATLRWAPRISGVAHLPLDLLALTTDSVIGQGAQLSFVQQGEILDIVLDGAYGPGDTLITVVHYHGDPVVDGSGWGGFYTSGPVFYDLGVAFQSQPHSFGRSWFPCFDNFVERCTFTFAVLTNAGRRTWCNGERISETQIGADTLLTVWRLNEPVPSYLASVTASDYTAVHDRFVSITGDTVPVELVDHPNDTTALKNSFLHLQQAFDAFEEGFGPYAWGRVGYCITPQGAMEHVTNISYPSSIVNGTLQYEATMAHELAHHWFGDLITCRHAEEMYINEGFAEYLSYLFLEAVYGPARYMEEVRDNHHAMLRRAHIDDAGWWALADMPQDHTYGTTTYNKGADALHTLRNYLGDSLFQTGLTSFLGQYAYSDVGTEDLRDHLSMATGIDMTDFFDDWILQPGWAAFEVDSFRVTPDAGNYAVAVHFAQKLRHADHYYHQVPVNISCVAGDGTIHRQIVDLGGATGLVQLSCPFPPQELRVNDDDRISLAITNDQDTLTQTGSRELDHTDLRLTVNTLPSAIPLFVQEYWVAADDWVEPEYLYLVSPDRWWHVGGQFPDGTSINARITFDGRPVASGAFDEGLAQDVGGVTFDEDSLTVLYRPDASFPWSDQGAYTINTLGSSTDKFARIDVVGFGPGDYTLAWRTSATAVQEVLPAPGVGYRCYPDPAGDSITIDRPDGAPINGELLVRDPHARPLMRHQAKGTSISLDISHLPAGVLVIGLRDGSGQERAIGKVVHR